jgi:hypothetical protein
VRTLSTFITTPRICALVGHSCKSATCHIWPHFYGLSKLCGIYVLCAYIHTCSRQKEVSLQALHDVSFSKRYSLPNDVPIQAQRGGGGIAPTHSQPVLEGGEWSAPFFGSFTPGEDPVPLCGRLGRLRDRSRWHVKFRPTGIRCPDRPAYTDYVILGACC